MHTASTTCLVSGSVQESQPLSWLHYMVWAAAKPAAPAALLLPAQTDSLGHTNLKAAPGPHSSAAPVQAPAQAPAAAGQRFFAPSAVAGCCRRYAGDKALRWSSSWPAVVSYAFICPRRLSRGYQDLVGFTGSLSAELSQTPGVQSTLQRTRVATPPTNSRDARVTLACRCAGASPASCPAGRQSAPGAGCQLPGRQH